MSTQQSAEEKISAKKQELLKPIMEKADKAIQAVAKEKDIRLSLIPVWPVWCMQRRMIISSVWLRPNWGLKIHRQLLLRPGLRTKTSSIG
ncbi:MAG: OmpH family outer membrane protein [Bacteroidota bacterium]|nr:MAG: OmpH family outer membrane protein [Bacteroidota bacterium]